jgi:hypothetical protein
VELRAPSIPDQAVTVVNDQAWASAAAGGRGCGRLESITIRPGCQTRCYIANMHGDGPNYFW